MEWLFELIRKGVPQSFYIREREVTIDPAKYMHINSSDSLLNLVTLPKVPENAQLRRTRILYLEVTDVCKAKCSFCFIDHLNQMKKFLDLEVLRKTLEDYPQLRTVPEVVLFGGEPVLWLTKERMVKLRELFPSSAFYLSTGLVYNESKYRELKQVLSENLLFDCQLSLDSDLCRDRWGDDFYETGLKRFRELLTEFPYATSIRITIVPHDPDVGKLIPFLEEVLQGRKTYIGFEFATDLKHQPFNLTKQQFEKIVNDLIEIFERFSINDITVKGPRGICSAFQQEPGMVTIKVTGELGRCHVGRDFFNIGMCFGCKMQNVCGPACLLVDGYGVCLTTVFSMLYHEFKQSEKQS